MSKMAGRPAGRTTSDEVALAPAGLPDRIWSSTEAGAYLGLTKRQVERLAAAGELPGRKIGRYWKFSPRVLERWFHERLEEARDLPFFQDFV